MVTNNEASSLLDKFEQFSLELNSEQLAATKSPIQHSLVIAGAGCGKTKTLVGRAAFLISQGVPPEKIQMLTFTRRAAKEMVDRVSTAMGKQPVCAGTFHSWCMALIKKSPGLFGLNDCTVIDEDDQLQIMKICRGSVATQKTKLLQANQLIALMSYSRNTLKKFSEAITEKHPEISTDTDQIEKIREILKLYEQRKRRNQYLDYDDILQLVATAIKRDPEVLKWVASGSEHILIDEMQDTNPLQWALIEPLSHYSTIYAVGDPRQSIYKFRGADFSNIYDFPNNLSNVSVYNLTINYRSTQEILDLSNWVMSNSSINYGAGLKSNRGAGLHPQIVTCADEMDEAQFIGDEILNNHSKGFSFQDNTILGRSVYGLRAIEAALIARSIPYRLFGGHSIFKSAHIKDVLSLVRAAGNFKDEIAWMRFLCLYKGIGEIKAESLIKNFLLSASFKQCSQIIGDSEFIPESAKALVEEIALSPSQSPFDIYNHVGEKLTPELARIYENQNWESRKRDIQLVSQIAAKHESILGFVEEYVLTESGNTGIKDADFPEDAVIVATIHAMKGAENNTVFLSNITADACPPAWACNSIDDVEEERRVFYVGLTRAKDHLYLTRREFNGFSDKKKFQNKSNFDPAAEYFLNEFPTNLLLEKISTTQKSLQTAHVASFNKRSPIDFGMDFD
ncbi:MAG: ATP-dependent helicase [Limnohabitans sp.]